MYWSRRGRNTALVNGGVLVLEVQRVDSLVLCHGTRATRDLVGQKSIGEEGHGKVGVVDISWLKGVNTTVRQGQVHSAVCTGRIHNLTAVLTIVTDIKPVRFKGKCIVVRFEIVGGDVAVLRPDDLGCHV